MSEEELNERDQEESRVTNVEESRVSREINGLPALVFYS